MIFLSSNHFSIDDQTADVIRHLKNGNAVEQMLYREFLVEFPEWDNLVWSNSYVDEVSSGVDIEFMSWVNDWIGFNTSVIWIDGEPVILEDSDDEENDEDEDTYYSGTGELVGDSSYENYLNHI